LHFRQGLSRMRDSGTERMSGSDPQCDHKNSEGQRDQRDIVTCLKITC
jgi:hypothetical protein